MKPTLLISKINDIKIIQVGESVLASKNKKQESNKNAYSVSKEQTKKEGQNTTIDLGKGAKKHTLKFFVFDRDENDAIADIIENERFCTIIDKFKGKIEVYIDDFKAIDSDKHINKTIYEISCTVQDVKRSPTVNFTAQLKNEVISMTADISTSAKDLIENEIASVDTILDVVTNTENFIDSVISAIKDGIMAVLDLQSDLLNAYKQVKSRVDKINRLVDTLKHILDFPQAFIDLMISITDEEKKQNVKIFEVMVRDKKLSEINVDDLSQIQYEEVRKVEKANQFNNLVTATMEIKQALNTDFTSQGDFEKHIETTIRRMEQIGYTYEEIVRKQQLLKSYANTQKYREIIEIEITASTPLTAIVYERYGNLDNYNEIEQLNNFKDNDIVYGTVKVYNASNNK